MSSINIANDTETAMDHLYPNKELEFLDKNGPPDPLIFKISEIIYRQCQKERIRKRQKSTANAYILIISCIFFTMMAALVITKFLEDNTRYSKIIFNATMYDPAKSLLILDTTYTSKTSYNPIIEAVPKRNNEQTLNKSSKTSADRNLRVSDDTIIATTAKSWIWKTLFKDT